MSRVLYVGVGKPWLGGAGYLVRQSVFLRGLADAADELHLAMFDCDAGDPPPPYARALTPLPRPARRPPGPVAGRLADRRSSVPRMFRGYDLAGPRAVVAGLGPDTFDAVFAYRIDFAHYAGVLGHRRLILDVDDPEHLRLFRLSLANGTADSDGQTANDLVKLRRFERDAERRAALAFVCQPNDARGWIARPEVVPNTVALPRSPARRTGRPVVLFVGNCGGSVGSANVDAVRHFLADIWPAVRAAVPEAEFHVVGAAGDAVRAAASGVDGAQVLGFVDDLTDAYATASVSVAPIRFGTGTRIKILEAMAHACPVLSTPLGAEGIEAVVGREIEIAVWDADFATRCVTMLCERDAAERIGAAGRLVAERLYDADAQRRRLAERFTRFLSPADAAAKAAVG